MIKRTIISAMASIMISNSTFAASYQKLDQYLETLQQHNKIMASLAISHRGELLYQKQIGFADLKQSQQLNADSKFRIGSITKIFTAVIILKLHEAGKLSLETRLAEFYPEIPNAKNITLAHLLSHRSGIFNLTDDRTYPGYMTQPQTKQTLLSIISSFSIQFEPDSQYSYSNSNYMLLGFIAEDVTGKKLDQLLDELIVKPLKLKHTFLGTDEPRTAGEVYSYRYAGDWELMPDTALSIPLGAGAMISTAEDINHFMTALFEGQLLSADSLERMKVINQGYGLGLMQFPFYERQAYGHGGGIDGFVSSASYFEEEQLAITVLSNAVNFAFNDVLIAALSAHFDKPFEIPDFTISKVMLDDGTMRSFEGDFGSEHLPMDIKVFVEGKELMAQATGQGAFPLTAYANNEFRFEQAGIVLKFSEDKTRFTLLQGGGKFDFTRK